MAPRAGYCTPYGPSITRFVALVRAERQRIVPWGGSGLVGSMVVVDLRQMRPKSTTIME